jgi:hypothetical protein
MQKNNDEIFSDLPVIDDIDLGINRTQEAKKSEPIETDFKVEPEKKAKSRRKLYIVLISLGVVLAITAIMVWLFAFKGIYVFQGLPLSSFSNSYYSIKIPEGYVRTENSLGESGTDITFVDPDESSEGIQSKVYLVSGEMTVSRKNDYFKALDEQYSKANIEKSHSSGGVNGAVDIVYSTKDWKGLESRTVSHVMARDKEHVGRYNKLVIYKSGKIYEIVITSPKYNPGLAVDAGKIFESFQIK